jgi:hypothetical protein
MCCCLDEWVDEWVGFLLSFYHYIIIIKLVVVFASFPSLFSLSCDHSSFPDFDVITLSFSLPFFSCRLIGMGVSSCLAMYLCFILRTGTGVN